MDDVLRDRLIGRRIEGEIAELADHIVVSLQHGPIPAIIPRTGAVATGVLLRDVDEADMTRFDAYELPFDYNRVGCDVRVGHTVCRAQVYMATDEVPLSDTVWDIGVWHREAADLSREMAREIGSYDPPLSGDQLAAQWHMIALRAGVRLRAETDTTPAARRYAPEADDVAVAAPPRLYGDFFKLSQFDVQHREFRGGLSKPLRREVLLACDAAIVLPYDPKTDCVLLVEQLRMGPLMRGAPNPWLLEPVAGMIDGTETPQDAARRETMEEAGLTNFALEEMFSFYASPGASTDYFFCFAALGSLPEPTTYLGGLAHENEDLRLHVMSFDDAMTLIETGEANVGPLIAMLLWLARHRDRLRAAA